MRTKWKMAILAGAAMLAAPAMAVSVVNPDGSVTLDGADPFSFNMNYNGFATSDQATIAGLTASIAFDFLGASADGLTYSFGYVLSNTSSAPVTESRVSVFGFDTLPDIVSASGAGLFSTVGSGNVPNVGGIDVCFKGGGGTANCAGGGGSGIFLGTSSVPSTFALTFGSAQSSVTLSNFFVRYQSIQGIGVGSASGLGTPGTPPGNPGGPGPVPEPASWAMMIAGFGMVGAAMRRRQPRMVTA